MAAKIRCKDEVIVLTGKHKGTRGIVTKILPEGRVVIQGINLIKKHQKPNPSSGIAAGIVEKEAPLHISNVALFNASTGKGDRVGFRFESDKKVRYFKSNNEIIK